MMFTERGDLLLDVHVTGEIPEFFCLWGQGCHTGGILRPNLFTVDDLLVSSLILFPLVGFFGRDGSPILDLEAETIHVCIAWALLNILGCFILFFTFLGLFLSHIFLRIVFSVHGIRGLVNNPPLSMWLGLVASETIRSCFCLKSISLVSRVASRLTTHSKWLESFYFTLFTPF